MIQTEENELKYSNYKEQFKRLNKAINNGFNLEAMFISYAIIEDRINSVLYHSGTYESYLKKRKGHNENIDSKIKFIKSRAVSNKKDLLNKYFSDSLLDDILYWKEERNRMIHALMKQELTAEELENLAVNGKTYARTLCNRATSYRRAVENKKVKGK